MENENKENGKMEEELAAYEKLRQRVSKIFGEIHEKINRETISQAMDKAMADLKEMGEHSKEIITRAGETLKKDIASSLGQIKPKVDGVTGDARKHYDQLHNKGGALWRDIAKEAEYIKDVSLDKGGSFLLNITRGLSEWSKDLSEKLDSSLVYKTGEMTHGGEFVCTSCGGALNLKKPGRMPPCPKCKKTEFRRS
ncbi:MAG: zinc ribbon-containing protein [Proteobacteria bacterium]|nr:zinc ribbon-containing protein [Pseudomonadota bacterium]MBU1738051.1 zinc ribbon-containing protein [Pseudomonadota bacterium]